MKVSFVFFTDPPRPFSSSVAQLAAVVRAAGHEASALEVGREERIVDAARRLEAEAADVVAISSMTRDWPGAAGLLRELESDAFVVVGGYHATMAPRDVALSPRVDAICIGE
ncbi:MAG: cobalamin-dependent protein, partial [Sandaracinaceae bacterium]